MANESYFLKENKEIEHKGAARIKLTRGLALRKEFVRSCYYLFLNAFSLDLTIISKVLLKQYLCIEILLVRMKVFIPSPFVNS